MKAKILIVDDEEIILAGWGYLLESAGYNVRTALTGADAVRIAEEQRPDIVFTDLIMPGMNGVEVCRQIKAIHPGTEIVLISGNPDEIRKCQMDFIMAGGKDKFLRKPVFTDELIKTTEEIMNKN